MAITYQLISSNTLASSATSVTFSSIPATYTDLEIRCSTRSDQASNIDLVTLTFNGSSAGNYSNTSFIGNSSTVTSNRGSGQPYLRNGYTSGNSTTANTFGSTTIYIPNYLSSNAKPVANFSVGENNSAATAAAYVSVYASLWSLTSAITSITISPINGPNWLTGSSFYLYGVKNS